jgi:hypothetical protein
MTKINLLLIAFATLFTMACHTLKNEKSATNIPAWLTQKIDANEKLPTNQSIQKILAGKYHGAKSYYIISPCCDQLNNLYDANGELICHPNGGMVKGGDGKCLDFETEFKGVVIWVKK